MLVRVAEAGDIPALVEMTEMIAAEVMWIGQQSPIDRDARAAQLLETLDGTIRGTVLVAERAEVVVGYAWLIEKFSGVIYLGMMLLPEARGQGLGSALLQACIDEARDRDAHKMALEVWPHNEAAIRLYEKFGFVHEGRLVRHYKRKNGEIWDSVLMALHL